MNRTVHTWRCAVIPLLVALVVTTVPLPCAAEGATPSTARPGLKASVDTAASALASAKPAPRAEAARQASGEAKTPTSKTFFKTPAGIAVLAIVAAGVGYAVYSAHHDRIPPQGR